MAEILDLQANAYTLKEELDRLRVLIVEMDNNAMSLLSDYEGALDRAVYQIQRAVAQLAEARRTEDPVEIDTIADSVRAQLEAYLEAVGDELDT